MDQLYCIDQQILYIRDVFAFMPLILREYLRFQVGILLVIWRIGTISQKLIYINLYQKN